MSNKVVLQMIKDAVVSRGLRIIAEDVARDGEAFAPESFAIQDPSGAAYFVTVTAMSVQGT